MNQQTGIKKRRTGTPAFWSLIAVGAIIFIVVFAILIDSAIYYNKVHSGVSVAGVSLGGQTKTEAMATVQAEVAKAQGSPITLAYGDKTWSLAPAAVGATIDVEGAVKAAMGVTRDGNLFSDIGTRWKLYFTSRDLPLTGTVDSAQLTAYIAGVAKDVDVAPVNAALSIENGKIKVMAKILVSYLWTSRVSCL